MAKRKGAELIAGFLVKEKIPYVFGICGHMADGYFRAKHRPVATLTSTGPGSANFGAMYLPQD